MQLVARAVCMALTMRPRYGTVLCRGWCCVCVTGPGALGLVRLSTRTQPWCMVNVRGMTSQERWSSKTSGRAIYKQGGPFDRSRLGRPCGLGWPWPAPALLIVYVEKLIGREQQLVGSGWLPDCLRWWGLA